MMMKYQLFWKYLIERIDLRKTNFQMEEIEEKVMLEVSRFWFVVDAP